MDDGPRHGGGGVDDGGDPAGDARGPVEGGVRLPPHLGWWRGWVGGMGWVGGIKGQTLREKDNLLIVSVEFL